MPKEKKAAVSLRLNVRPLGSNWKAVKRVEFTESPEAPHSPQSPAHDQLDGKVWKTKVVRTEFVKEKPIISVFESEDESDVCTESTKIDSSGVVEPCKCKKCIGADNEQTSIEISPVPIVQTVGQDEENKGKREVEQEVKRTRSRKWEKSLKQRKPSHSHHCYNDRSSRSAPQVGWNKLYKPRKHKKEPILPSMHPDSICEAPPPPPPPPSAANSRYNQLPRVLKAPSLSEISDDSEKEVPREKIFLVPPMETKPIVTVEQPKPKLLARDSIEVAHLDVAPEPVKENQLSSIVSSNKNKKSTVETPAEPVPVTILSEPIETAISTEPRSTVVEQKNALKKMESYFYEAESNMWMLIALMFLTILSYRFSIDPHTCYYD